MMDSCLLKRKLVMRMLAIGPPPTKLPGSIPLVLSTCYGDIIALALVSFAIDMSIARTYAAKVHIKQTIL